MLSRSSRLPVTLAHISLTLVGLMWVLPFLYYHHAYPITTFYQEWGSALLALCAFPLLLTARYWEAPEVPRIVLLPLGFLLVLMLQFFAGRITHFDHLLLLSLYFLFAALLMMLGQRLRVELGLPAVATTLAVFLLVGAELNTLAGILQHYRWSTFLGPVVTAKTAHAVYGNLAQPNHYASYLAAGLISLGLLHVRRVLPVWSVVLLAAPMLFVLTLSGSRSAWLYLLCMAALAFLWQRRVPAWRPLLSYCALLLLGFVLMQWVVEIPWLRGPQGSVTTVDRLFGDNASGYIRLLLWREAALIFARFPWLGAGFGQFAFEHLQLAAELRNPLLTGLYNNAHNLVMQVAAETGIPGLVALLGPLVLWLRQAIAGRTHFTPYHWWGYAILAVLGIHSMLEYPLWYAYFMGVAAFMLGVFDMSSYSLELRALGRASLAATLLLAAASLQQAASAYSHLERALVLRSAASVDGTLAPRARDELLAAYRYPLLNSYAELFIASGMVLGADQVENKFALNERALRFIPIAPLAYHQAMLLAMSDRPEEARAQMERAIWGYGADYPRTSVELEALARDDTSRFAGLLEFATRKHEEYRRAAVSAK